MKLLLCLILGAGLSMPVWADGHRPRPEAAIAKLDLSPELREQVLAVFAAAHERHETLREQLDDQRAANDAEFCAIRGETQKALAKLLSHDRLEVLNAALRPPRAARNERPADRGPPGALQGRNGGRRPPPPPRCDAATALAEHGE